MQFEEVKKFLLDKLAAELPSYLTYHNCGHTVEVIKRAHELGVEARLSEKDLKILLTAALFHDAGFILEYQGHENISCEYARDILPAYNYSAEDIEQITHLIMATREPRQPDNELSKLLCDADCYYLGTDRYDAIAATLYDELRVSGQLNSEDQWISRQIGFLRAHEFFTHAAKQKLQQTFNQNLKKLELKQNSLRKPGPGLSFMFGELLLICVGVIIAGFALKGFLIPNSFFDGGVTGFSLLIHELYHFNIAYVIVLANLPFIAMGYFIISRKFAQRTFLCILLLGLCLLYIPYPVVTSDKLLISIFGGFFLGLGTGITMRAGCAIDGIEVLAVYTLKRTSFTISEIILGINIIIFTIAAFKFGIPVALYSMLTYFIASKTIDYVIEGVEAYTGVTIISGKSERIKERLVKEMHRGITVYKGERGYLPGNFEVHYDCDILFTIITRLEMRKLKNLVAETDPNAFIFASTIKEASGGVMKRRHVH